MILFCMHWVTSLSMVGVSVRDIPYSYRRIWDIYDIRIDRKSIILATFWGILENFRRLEVIFCAKWQDFDSGDRIDIVLRFLAFR